MFRTPPPARMKRRHARRRAHQLVLETGNAYAYQFVATRRPGELLEVRVLRGGRVTYTRTDPMGRPLAPARVGFWRAGGLRGQEFDANTLPLAAGALALLALLADLLPGC